MIHQKMVHGIKQMTWDSIQYHTTKEEFNQLMNASAKSEALDAQIKEVETKIEECKKQENDEDATVWAEILSRLVGIRDVKT